jgi:hypothetical protein
VILVGITLTEEEKNLVQEGKLNPSDILEHRKLHPVKTVDVNELDAVKQEIKDTNILYKDSIQKNKDLYDELQQNRKRKEELRNKIAELRLKKKKLLGIVE